MAKNSWKGIILAGGSGTRLWPLTAAVNKHLLPVFDKPMIYYPLSTLMLGGLRDIILITGPESVDQFQRLLEDGSQWGLNIKYMVQERPGGIAECFRIADKEIAGSNVAVILGDNIFYSDGLASKIETAMSRTIGATIFACEVVDPTSFGVVELDAAGQPVSLEEKPAHPRSNLAVPGLYLYDSRVVDIAKGLKPSARGELEITDVNRAYLAKGELYVHALGRGTAWLDGGTHSSLYDAGQFIKVLEERTGLKIACPEEIAFRKRFISLDQLRDLATSKRSGYSEYLMGVISSSSGPRT